MWGGFCCSAPQYGRGGGGRGGTHTGTRTGTYTRMLHLPFSDLPLKKCPVEGENNNMFVSLVIFALGGECRPPIPPTLLAWELRNIYHHHPESKKRNSSEANSGSIHPYGRYGNAAKTRKTISTIAILWPVKAIFEKRAATVEVDSFVSPACCLWISIEYFLSWFLQAK